MSRQFGVVAVTADHELALLVTQLFLLLYSALHCAARGFEQRFKALNCQPRRLEIRHGLHCGVIQRDLIQQYIVWRAQWPADRQTNDTAETERALRSRKSISREMINLAARATPLSSAVPSLFRLVAGDFFNKL